MDLYEIEARRLANSRPAKATGRSCLNIHSLKRDKRFVETFIRTRIQKDSRHMKMCNITNHQRNTN